MPDLMFPIMTALSIDLMNQFDEYRSNSIKLLTDSQFPSDVTIALRQQLNKDIDTLIDVIAKNPPTPVVVVPELPFELPKVTTRKVPVFVSDVPVATVPTPPVVGA